MANSKTFFLLLCFLFIFLQPSYSSNLSQNPNPNPNSTYENPSSSNLSQNPNPNSAHVELKNKGFPIGLLPKSILDYSLNRTSGDFSVHLDDSCRITLPPDNYVATYSRRITGKILEGRIAELEGIQVRAFFKWWSISGIRSSGENIVFEVGMVTAKYASKNFDAIPECEGRRSSS